MVWMIPIQLVVKLFLDCEKPVGSDFTLGERKKFSLAISREQGRWNIFLTPFAARDS
jgi:hypothetical protein